MMLFTKLSLRLQIVIPLAIAILAGVGISVLIGIQVTKEQQLISNIYAEALSARAGSHSVSAEIEASEKKVAQMLSMTSFISASEVEKTFTAHDVVINQALAKLTTNKLSHEINDEVRSLATAYEIWKSSVQIILGMSSSDTVPTTERLGREYKAAVTIADHLSELVSLTAKAKTEAANTALNSTIKFELITLIVLGLLAVAGSWLIANGIARPIQNITGLMGKLVEGQTDITLPNQNFASEINGMISALEVFQLNSQKVQNMTAEKLVVEEKNMEMMRNLSITSDSLTISSGDIRSSSQDFSERTKQQAASVEETAAAVHELTESVKNAETRAEDAGQLVAKAKSNAENSSAIVNSAIEAMDRIKTSSHEIANIIGVIDEISFQTNLLALNAGVEAARAGDAGRGFAIVAQEVRNLAQRSASSAKEIKELITASSGQVATGVKLVNETGAALEAIALEVHEVNGHVTAIVDTTREQSHRLQEINMSINSIDQGTRKNSTMVEQSTSANNALADDIIKINKLINRFEITDERDEYISSTTPSTQIIKDEIKQQLKVA